MTATRIERLYWSTDDIIAITHGEQTAFPRQVPGGIRSLKGTGIERAQNVMTLLRDEDGRVVGSGTELEVLPEGGSGIMQVYFTIVLPDRGTLFVHEHKHYGQADPEWLAIFEQVQRTGESWSGSRQALSTVGPGPDGKAVLLAGTGEFAGMTGTMVEEATLRQVGKDGWFTEVCETFELTG